MRIVIKVILTIICLAVVSALGLRLYRELKVNPAVSG